MTRVDGVMIKADYKSVQNPPSPVVAALPNSLNLALNLASLRPAQKVAKVVLRGHGTVLITC